MTGDEEIDGKKLFWGLLTLILAWFICSTASTLTRYWLDIRTAEKQSARDIAVVRATVEAMHAE